MQRWMAPLSPSNDNLARMGGQARTCPAVRLATLCCHLLAPARKLCPSPSSSNPVADDPECTGRPLYRAAHSFQHSRSLRDTNLASRGHHAAKVTCRARPVRCDARYAVSVAAPIARRAGHVIHALSGSGGEEALGSKIEYAALYTRPIAPAQHTRHHLGPTQNMLSPVHNTSLQLLAHFAVAL